MNIVVETHSGRCVVRPDITWDKRNEDIFLPDFVTEVSWTPVLFARITRPGRSVEKRFADRYFDAVGYGLLLYPENLIDGSEEGFACASCIDHTSILPSPFFDRVIMDVPGNGFSIEADESPLYSCPAVDGGRIAAAIEAATSHVFVRTGDILAVELQERRPLLSRAGGKTCTALRARCCVRDTIEFNIIL